ncbi:MAG: sulfate reduction electron transfer complex DsrMKJOP subunit DsrO [Planctomycetota bacterium]|jgi:molybdopterin-containing oxidoreductase family iron-sulfur binding subunit
MEDRTSLTSRRGFLKASGACAVGIGCGVPILAALASEKGLFDADEDGPRWAMVVDTKKCAEEKGCTKCLEACHATHNVPEIDDPKEEIKWIWKEGFEKAFPTQEHEYLAEGVRERDVLVLCNHCENPPCVRVCPTKATWKRDDGVVMMDMHRCIGCRYCIVGCPYGSRSFNWSDPRKHLDMEKADASFPTRSKGVVEKCNFCAERQRHAPDGKWTPACVEDPQEAGSRNRTARLLRSVRSS